MSAGRWVGAIAVLVAACSARPAGDGIATAARNDGETTPVNETFTYDTPAPCSVFVASVLFDPPNDLAQYTVRMRPSGPMLTLIYRVVVGSDHPLQFLAYVGSGGTPFFTARASEASLQLLGPSQAVVLDVSPYLESSAQAATHLGASEEGDGGGDDAGADASTMTDVLMAARCILPSRTDPELGVPAFVLNRAEAPAEAGISGYSADGEPLIPWGTPEREAPGTLLDALFDVGACTEAASWQWICSSPASP